MEFGYVIEEIKFAIRHLKNGQAPKEFLFQCIYQPAKGYIVKEPYGNVLIIGAFNYPFQLVFVPLIGAIAAGNCALVKPSKSAVESAKVTLRLLKKPLIKTISDALCLRNILRQNLSAPKFGLYFLYGKLQKGALVAEAAGKNLVPYTA